MPEGNFEVPDEPDAERPVLLVASSGGHLAQLITLRPWWSGLPRRWVTFPTPDAQSQLVDESCTWAFYPTTRNLPNLLRNFGLAWRVMRRERPSMVVSTGAAVAVPFFVLALLMRVPRVYVEVYDRVDSRTLTGRICHPISSLFLVQWESQLRLYPRAQLLGPLL